MAALNPIHVSVRADICRSCPSPCPERDTLDLSDGCTECPRRIWHAIDCDVVVEEPAGDKAARLISSHVLDPLGRMIPAAQGLIQQVQRCGGCGADKQRLNGNGGGSAI